MQLGLMEQLQLRIPTILGLTFPENCEDVFPSCIYLIQTNVAKHKIKYSLNKWEKTKQKFAGRSHGVRKNLLSPLKKLTQDSSDVM
jgi:hypothetical protein